MLHFTIYSRAYCHLCDDMVTALSTMAATHPFTFDVIDVDADEALVARYDELVPVLMQGEHEICHHFLDRDGLIAALARQ